VISRRRFAARDKFSRWFSPDRKPGRGGLSLPSEKHSLLCHRGRRAGRGLALLVWSVTSCVAHFSGLCDTGVVLIRVLGLHRVVPAVDLERRRSV